MDSHAFLDAARAVLMDSQGIAKGRISNDALFTAIEARLGIEKLPRRMWAKHLSSLGLKPARWNKGKIRGWQLFDVTPKLDVTPKSEPPAGRPKCRVRLPNPEAAGYTTYTTKEALLEAVEKYPHLRPCPKKDWWWLEWKYCERCDWKLPVPVADLSPAASGPAIAS